MKLILYSLDELAGSAKCTHSQQLYRAFMDD